MFCAGSAFCFEGLLQDFGQHCASSGNCSSSIHNIWWITRCVFDTSLPFEWSCRKCHFLLLKIGIDFVLFCVKYGMWQKLAMVVCDCDIFFGWKEVLRSCITYYLSLTSYPVDLLHAFVLLLDMLSELFRRWIPKSAPSKTVQRCSAQIPNGERRFFHYLRRVKMSTPLWLTSFRLGAWHQ